MAVIFKNVTSPYFSNGLIDHQETWHGDDIALINFTVPSHTLCLLFYINKLQKIILKLASGR